MSSPLGWWRRALRLVATTAFIVPLWWLSAPAAQAHASLVSTNPSPGQVVAASPGEVSLAFDEPITMASGGARLFDATGSELDATGASRDRELIVDIPDQLAQGSYVLVWRIVSADGHPVNGSLVFSVLQASEVIEEPLLADTDTASSAWLATSTAALYLLVLTGVGVSWAGTSVVVGGNLGRAWTLGPLVGVVPLSVAWLWATVNDQQGTALSLSQAWAAAPGALRLSALLFVGAVALAAVRRRWSAWSGIGLAAISAALTGHSRAEEPVWLSAAADAMHTVAGAIWLGGLLALSLVWRRLSASDLAASVTAFSSAAAASLIGVALTGTFLAWRIVGSWSALVTTGYGWLLVAKIGLVAAVAAMGAWNRWRLLPQLGQPDATVWLRRTVRAEALVLAAVVALTGVLVTQSPTAEPTAPSLVTTGTASVEDLTVTVALHPGSVGPNHVVVTVTDAVGAPVTLDFEPEVSLRSDEFDLGTVELTRDGAEFFGEVIVPEGGAWEAQVSVKLSEFDNPVVVIDLVLADG